MFKNTGVFSVGGISPSAGCPGNFLLLGSGMLEESLCVVAEAFKISLVCPFSGVGFKMDYVLGMVSINSVVFPGVVIPFHFVTGFVFFSGFKDQLWSQCFS